MLFDLTNLRKLVDEETEKLPNCEADTTVKIENLAETREDSVKEHLLENKCMVKEICSKRSNYDDGYLAEEIESYIEAFQTSNDEERFDKNANIKDEIDEAIYHVIFEVLKGQKRMDVDSSHCVSEFMMRTNVVDSFYSPDFLINPAVEQYKKIYKF
jgi:hypothetical protein